MMAWLTIFSKACSRVFSHSSVSRLMFPPTMVCRLAPRVPKIERERTIMPRTRPRLWVMRKPSRVNAVVTKSWVICGSWTECSRALMGGGESERHVAFCVELLGEIAIHQRQAHVVHHAFLTYVVQSV